MFNANAKNRLESWLVETRKDSARLDWLQLRDSETPGLVLLGKKKQVFGLVLDLFYWATYTGE
jgi:hypothetical protein